MTGHRIRLPKGAKVKDGKVVVVEKRPRDRSHAIAMKKSKKQRAVTAGKADLETAKRGK